MGKEFKIGDTVSLDRYNRKGKEEKAKVIGFGTMPFSKAITYKMDVNGTVIESNGKSIMESKFYEPVPDEERDAPRPKWSDLNDPDKLQLL
jgi:hypothetical protein